MSFVSRAARLGSVVAVLGLVLSATSSARAGEALSQAELGRMLDGMGLSPKLDDQRYDFQFNAVHRGRKWNLSMSAVLSANGKSVWLVAWLDELPKSAADVPRTALLRLLADNDRLGRGKFFAYVPANRRFVLQRVVPNDDLTPASFRDALQDLGGSVAETYGHWSVAGWAAESEGSTGRPPVIEATRDASKFRPTSRN